MFHVPHPSYGPEGFFCCVKGCINFGTKKPPGVTFHKFPSDLDQAKEWIRIIRENSLRSDVKDRPLSRNCIICSDHFNQRDIDRMTQSRPRIREGAVPTLFPAIPEYLRSKHTIIRKIPIRRESEDVQDVHSSISKGHSGSSDTSLVSQVDNKQRPSISEVKGLMYKVSHASLDEEDSDDSSSQCDIITVDAVEEDLDQIAHNTINASCPRTKKRGRPRARVQTVVPPTSEILYNVLVKTDRFRSSLPPNWHRIVHVAGANGCVIFTCYESNKLDGSLPVCVREVFVDRACRVHCFVGGTHVDLQTFSINDDVNTLEDVVRLVAAVDALRICRGAFHMDECRDVTVPGARLDLDMIWRADDCPQVLRGCRSCDGCLQMRKIFLQRLRKARQEDLAATTYGVVEDDNWLSSDNSHLYQHFLADASSVGDSLHF